MVDDDRYSEFYQLLDTAFLRLPSISISQFEARILEIAKLFDSERTADPRFAVDMRREVLIRLLIAFIEKDVGVEQCWKQFKEISSFGFSDVLSEWLVVCQVSRYLRRHRRSELLSDRLAELKLELLEFQEGCQECLDQIEEEIRLGGAN